MTTTWMLYADPGLTSELSAGIPVAQAYGGPPTDVVIYFGSVAVGKTLQAASSPGFDPITLTPVDAAPGGGVEVSMISLASTAAGLDAATPGAALSVGVVLQSGAENAIPVWVRVSAGALAESATAYADAGIERCAVVET